MHADKSHLLVLVLYTSLILVGAGVLYWFRGWRSLLFISAIGSWLVILFCYFNFAFSYETISSERWDVAGGNFPLVHSILADAVHSRLFTCPKS